MEPTPEEREKWELQQIKQSHSRFFARPIGTVMRRLMNSKNYGAIQSSQSLQDVWPKIVGEKLVAATRLGKISRGALLIEANSSQALQELHFQKATILKQCKPNCPSKRSAGSPCARPLSNVFLFLTYSLAAGR